VSERRIPNPKSKSNSSTLGADRNFNCAVGGVKGGLHKTPLKSKGKTFAQRRKERGKLAKEKASARRGRT